MDNNAATIIQSIIANIPGFIAAIAGALYARQAHKASRDNGYGIERLNNGVMDRKIENAVRKVIRSQPTLATEANIRSILEEVLTEHTE